MRKLAFLLLCIVVLSSGCARRTISTTDTAPVSNSDAIAPTQLVPLPAIADDHPAPDKTQGLDKAETAQADKPDDPTVNYNLALSYYKAKAFADAARMLERSSQLMPDNPQPLLYLGYTQMSVGALDNALKTFDRVLSMKGVSHMVVSEAYYNIGVCQAALKKTDEAIAAYTKAIGNNPKNGLASLALGARAAERGQIEQANAFFVDAADDLPMGRHKAQALAALGKLAEGRKDLKTAISRYRQALAIDRDNSWADEGLRRLSPGKNG